MSGWFHSPPGSHSQREHGFTLIELVVAMGILAVASAMMFSGFGAVVKSHNKVKEEQAHLSQLQLLHSLLAQDLEQAVMRSSAGGGDFLGTGGGLNGRILSFAVVRLLDSPIADASLRRISYEIRDETLYRTVTPSINPGRNQIMIPQKLTEGVKMIQLAFLGRENGWRGQWNSTHEEGELPLAVDVRLTMEGWDTLRWVFRVTETLGGEE